MIALPSMACRAGQRATLLRVLLELREILNSASYRSIEDHQQRYLRQRTSGITRNLVHGRSAQ